MPYFDLAVASNLAWGSVCCAHAAFGDNEIAAIEHFHQLRIKPALDRQSQSDDEASQHDSSENHRKADQHADAAKCNTDCAFSTTPRHTSSEDNQRHSLGSEAAPRDGQECRCKEECDTNGLQLALVVDQDHKQHDARCESDRQREIAAHGGAPHRACDPDGLRIKICAALWAAASLTLCRKGETAVIAMRLWERACVAVDEAL